ncbi:hypothetical protein VTL71DRAFT_7711 [Oculimacula yallundae]|uniref:Shelterin complex subunit TPP1/Est3 domain-containing protein n=1 Tax=Oculimacula yallundae TaxID=86028 RepID=A0ABR4BUW1_9HELO
MAGALRLPWIGTSVENELTGALGNFKSYMSGQPELKKENRYCRPGRVEIHCSKRRQAQVTSFPGGMRNPYDAILSDGTHQIPAIFDKDAALSFTENFHRDYHSIEGGIIIINKYHLVVDAALAPNRLTLRVLDFRLDGAEGSAVMGRPVDILTDPDFEQLVARLERLCAPPQESTQDQLSSSTSRDKSSQLSNGFATQVNHGKERPVSSPVVAQESRTSIDDAFIAHLLGAAKNPQAVVTNPADNLAQAPVLGSVTGAKAHALKSKLDNRMNIRSSHPSTSLASSNVQDEDTLKSVDNDMKTHSPLHSCLGDDDKENSQEYVSFQNSSPVQPKTKTPVQLQRLPLFVDQLQHDNAFKGLKRVPQRFVRIPKDQNTMLERNDCWYEPQVGDRPRYANIPAKVMDDLTEFMERNPTEPQVELTRLNPGPSVSEDDPDEESDADSEYDTPDERPAGGHNEQNLDASLERGHHDDMGRFSNDKSPPPGNQTARDRLASHGPKIVDQEKDSDNDTDDDDRVSWDATPEPDDTAHQLLFNNKTPTQPRLMDQLPSTPSNTTWKSQTRPHARIPVHIPSSSPTREEEIELAVPYAVGDVVELEDVQVQTTINASQELPSTAPPSSKYIQVKRTPYVKSRSFDEDLLCHTATGSRRAEDDVSSDPIIPATFNDTSMSGKQTSSLTDQAPTSIDRISGTQTLLTNDVLVHTQTNAVQDQDPAESSALGSRDEPTEEVSAHKTIAVGTLGSERSRAVPGRHQRLSGHSSIMRPGGERGMPSRKVSPQPKPQTAAHSKVPRETGRLTSNGASHIRTGKAPETTSVPTHLSKKERQMFFSNIKIDENASEGKELAELLLEEKRKARDAKRNFRAQERLTRQRSGSVTDIPNLPSSPNYPMVSNSHTLEKESRRFRSPTPDLSTGNDENMALVPSVEIEPMQDRLVLQEPQPPSINGSQSSAAVRTSSRAVRNQSLPRNTAGERDTERDLSARKPFRETPLWEVLVPSTPSYGERHLDDLDGGTLPDMKALESEFLAAELTQIEQDNGENALLEAPETEVLQSVEPEIDQHDDHSPLQKGLVSEGLKAAQPSIEITDDEDSPPEATAETEDLELDSRMNEKDKPSPNRTPTPVCKPSSMNTINWEDGLSPGREFVQAANAVPLEHSELETRGQSSPRQTLQTTKLVPRGENQLNDSQIEETNAVNAPTYDNFRLTYPEYAGDKRSFTRALVCVEWLRLQRIPPWSMCDDFIRVYVEFEPFVRTLVKEGNPPLGAWEFYDKHVKTLLFEKRFIDDEDKLTTALSLLNPLYVQNLRRGYNAPAADKSQAKVLKRNNSMSAVPQVRRCSTTKSLQTAQTPTEGRPASPELGSTNNPPQRHSRKPFFETPSQIQSIQRSVEHENLARPIPDVERSDKKKRTLPWAQDRITSSPLSRGDQPVSRPASPSLRSSESRKRRHPDDQKSATIAPPLRRSLAKSTTAGRKENSSRPASRDSELFKSRHSTFQAARVSPELPDFTEKWVSQQQLTEDPIVEKPKISELTSLPQKHLIKESFSGRRKSGLSANADSPGSTKKRPNRDLAEVARLYAQRRRSGGLSSRASTPQSTPAKRFCTKPKTETSAKRLEPETQAWEY